VELIPPAMAAFAERNGAAGEAWVARLPELIERCAERWAIDVHGPLEDGCGRAAWVGLVTTSDGDEAVLKLAWPHEEARTEAAGLRFFDGRGAARLLESDEAEFALLVERCIPGVDLYSVPDLSDADRVAARVLRQLWRSAEGDERARPIGTIADTVDAWNARFATTRTAYPADLVAEASELGRSLAASTTDPVVVHGDFNPFNILTATREPWLAIDPKPLVGDRAYDLAQYLANRFEDAEASGRAEDWFSTRVDWFARELDLDPARVAGWLFVKSVGWNWGPRAAAVYRQVHRVWSRPTGP
jgi:streptomycin 6-kinase